MNKYHNISNIKFEGNFLVITINGIPKKINLKKVSPTLETASDEERNKFEISPSGYGIHWPLIDEDLSIDSLLGIINKSG